MKGKIDARNALETSVYNMKSSVEDKLKDKISEEDSKKVKAAITEINEWLDENSDAEQVSCCPLSTSHTFSHTPSSMTGMADLALEQMMCVPI